MSPATIPAVLLLASLLAASGAAAQEQVPVRVAAPEERPKAPGREQLPEPGRSRGLGIALRLGGLYIAPLGRSSEVSLAGVSGPARLAVSDGPIPGSGVRTGSALLAAGSAAWFLPALDGRLALETVLALPIRLRLEARGTLAARPIAPTALGDLPTGVPALGPELGEVRVLPPVVTLTWRLGPWWRLSPYLGAGASYLIVLDARVTNPVLTEVSAPRLRVPNKLGLALQAGLDLRLFGDVHATLDAKYIAGLAVTARVEDAWVRLPALPLYGAVRVGDNTVRVAIDPLVLQLGVGVDF